MILVTFTIKGVKGLGKVENFFTGGKLKVHGYTIGLGVFDWIVGKTLVENY